mmetsp:Transcript_7058/g.24495  ORF Transcript_7058/g.24495 Transcript_7058/m.24495 type:complete len:203 (+) Transcript_7058:191-799(+)
MHCGSSGVAPTFFAKSCACVQQCRHVDGAFDQTRKAKGDADPPTCFTRLGVPESAQTSLIPEASETFKWWRLDKGVKKEELSWEEGVRFENAGPHRGQLPLSMCQDSCEFHGECIQRTPDDPPKCLCYPGWRGKSCSLKLEKGCYNDCSGRGECLQGGYGLAGGGYCTCDDGHYGIDCFRCSAPLKRGESYASKDRGANHKP